METYRAIEQLQQKPISEDAGLNATIAKALQVLWMVECGYIHIHTDKMAPQRVRDWVYVYKKTELMRG